MARADSTLSKVKTSASRLALLNGLSNELAKIALATVSPKTTPAKLTAIKSAPTALTAPAMPTMTPMKTTSRSATPTTGSPSPAPAPAVGIQ